MPRNRQGHPSYRPHTCGMCFTSGYPSRVAPQRCPVRLPEVVATCLSDFWCKGTAFF